MASSPRVKMFTKRRTVLGISTIEHEASTLPQNVMRHKKNVSVCVTAVLWTSAVIYKHNRMTLPKFVVLIIAVFKTYLNNKKHKFKIGGQVVQ